MSPSHSGVLVPRRQMIMHTCGQCVNKCNQKLSISQRQDIFHNFWQMSDHTRQRDFICSHAIAKQKNRHKTLKSRRTETFHYFLSVGGQKVKVCKAVFLSTLNVGEKWFHIPRVMQSPKQANLFQTDVAVILPALKNHQNSLTM